MPDTIEAAPTVQPASPENETINPAPLNDSFSKAFDEYFPTEQPEPKPDAKEGKTTTDKPDDKGKEKTIDKSGDKKPDEKETEKTEDHPNKKPEDGKKVDPDKPVRKTPWQLVHEYEAQISELKKQVRSSTEKPIAEHPEYKGLSEKYEAAQKRLSELEDRIRYVDYSASDEYKAKYETPFVNAYTAGRNKTASMSVLTDDSGGSRKGTPDDFDRIMSVMDDDQAATLADEMFGSKAPLVLYHRERVMELNNARNKALEEYREKGSEMAKTQKEQYEKSFNASREQVEKYWQKHVLEPRERYAQFGKPIEGDEKGNELLEKGYERAHKAFANLNPLDPRLSPEQREEMVKLHGMIINKAAWFDRVVYQGKAKDAQIKELQDKLKKFEESSPKGGTDRRGTDKKQPTWEEQLDALAR